eukprot:jgi/Botrbrau1/14842/Bobra.0278s0012.1
MGPNKEPHHPLHRLCNFVMLLPKLTQLLLTSPPTRRCKSKQRKRDEHIHASSLHTQNSVWLIRHTEMVVWPQLTTLTQLYQLFNTTATAHQPWHPKPGRSAAGN